MSSTVELANFDGYKNGMTSSCGSAEDDSMSGSDASSPGVVDVNGQSAQILLQFDASTGTFTEPGGAMGKAMRMDRSSSKRQFIAPYGSLNHLSAFAGDSLMDANPMLIRAISSLNTPSSRRQRSEKKPIPPEHKDDKYFERRRRNNHAAKKSRDIRKQREDEVAIRASWLEKENAVLKAQLSTLRDEAEALKHMLMQKRQQHQHQQQQQQANLSRFMALTSMPAHIQV